MYRASDQLLSSEQKCSYALCPKCLCLAIWLLSVAVHDLRFWFLASVKQPCKHIRGLGHFSGDQVGIQWWGVFYSAISAGRRAVDDRPPHADFGNEVAGAG